MSSKIKVLVLTTKQNFVWNSMSEIIPGIEKAVFNLKSTEVDVKIINVDKIKLKNNLLFFLQADYFVLTAFNKTIASTAIFIRKTLSLTSPFLIYTHGLASIGCWPLFQFKLGEYLCNIDIFICNCSKDKIILNQLFPKNKTKVVPFLLTKLDHYSGRKKYPTPDFFHQLNLVYVGRLSAQKNLITLIKGYAQARKELHRTSHLHIFGAEDFLGEPNFEISQTESYLDKILHIIKKLELSNHVTLHGHLPREYLFNFLCEQDYVFITTSTHSDENFGMAALRVLAQGRHAILTDWGGHSDFVHSFPHQTHYLTVYSSEDGPWVPVESVKKIILNNQKNSVVSKTQYILDYYLTSSISSKLLKVMDNDSSIVSKISLGKICTQTISQRKQLQDKGFKTKVFKNKNDRLAFFYLKQYGMVSASYGLF